MNPQNLSAFPNSQTLPDESRLTPHFAGQDEHSDPELELWEPPFERWLRLADDLLRDWPHGPAVSQRA
jgi:hypothetical protein